MKSRSPVADLAYVAVFAALIIVFAFVSIPVGAAGVPVVLQNGVILLTALILGPKRAFFAVLLFLALGLVGLPVLAGGRTTLAAMAGPTVGYLVGYLVSAPVAGALAYRAPARRRGAQIGWFIAAALVGLIIQYLCGIVGLMVRGDMALGAATAVQGPFLAPDLAKAAVAIVIALGVHAAFPDFLTRPHANRRVS